MPKHTQPQKHLTQAQPMEEPEDIDEQLKSLEEEVLDITAKSIGLVLYTTQERGWPTGVFTKEDLLKGIHKNTYKWIYSSTQYTEDNILNLIRQNKIRLSDCWKSVSKDIFRKIRSGLLQDRSLIDPRENRIRKFSQ